MWMNKKGVGVDDFIPLFIMILFFFFFIGFVFIMGNNRVGTVQANTNEEREGIVSQDILVSYLEASDGSRTKFDFLVGTSSSGQVIMPEDDKAYFSRIYDQGGGNNWRSWRLIVAHPKGGESSVDGNLGTNQGGGAPKDLASIVAPLDEDDIVIVRLSKVGFGSALDPQSLEMP